MQGGVTGASYRGRRSGFVACCIIAVNSPPALMRVQASGSQDHLGRGETCLALFGGHEAWLDRDIGRDMSRPYPIWCVLRNLLPSKLVRLLTVRRRSSTEANYA